MGGMEFLMPSYVENMVGCLKRMGYAPKYQHAGIYCIKLDDQIVYIGKSANMTGFSQTSTITYPFSLSHPAKAELVIR